MSPETDENTTQVKTWDDLAAILGYNTREFRRWRKEPGAPLGPDVEAWRAFLATKGKPDPAVGGPITPADPDELPGKCAYDRLVKDRKTTYAEAKMREQVKSEQIANEIKEIERDKARGALVTKEEAEKAAALVRDRLEARYDRAIARALGELAAEQPAAMPAELRAKILAQINLALDAD